MRNRKTAASKNRHKKRHRTTHEVKSWRNAWVMDFTMPSWRRAKSKEVETSIFYFFSSILRQQVEKRKNIVQKFIQQKSTEKKQKKKQRHLLRPPGSPHSLCILQIIDFTDFLETIFLTVNYFNHHQSAKHFNAFRGWSAWRFPVSQEMFKFTSEKVKSERLRQTKRQNDHV